jgi:aminoglycoside phosphotransferase (APT) family kinase protein
MVSELRGIDRDSVDAWLARNIVGSTPPFEYKLVAAGGSNLTYRVSDAAGQQWALRRPPAGHTLPTAHDMHREYRLMAALADTAVPVPQCFAYCSDNSVTGAQFYVMSFVEGHILRDRASCAGMTEHDADVATDSLIDVQIAMHRVDVDAVGLGDLAKRDDYVGRQLKRWRSQVERVNLREIPLLIELHERLTAAKPPEVAPPGLAHGDYRFDNTVLGADWNVIAVLDWELCTIGNPIADFAWSMLYWTDPGATMYALSDPPTLLPIFVRSDEVIRRYGARSGFDLSDLPYYRVFSWWKQACIVEGAYARRLSGATGGMASSGNVSDIGRRVENMLEHAHELAHGVL